MSECKTCRNSNFGKYDPLSDICSDCMSDDKLRGYSKINDNFSLWGSEFDHETYDEMDDDR